jgi:diketogulonate reductase-like aldo/keto reductase
MASRRQLLAMMALLPWQAALGNGVLLRSLANGERFPAIGLGTWQAFDIGDEPAHNAEAAAAVRALVDGGGRLIDTSPMYGRAEAALGRAAVGLADRLYLASKIYVHGADEGRTQFARTLDRMQRPGIDLMQVLPWQHLNQNRA